MDNNCGAYSPAAVFVSIGLIKKNSKGIAMRTTGVQDRYIHFSDGYKTDRDRELVLAVGECVKSINGFRSVTVIGWPKTTALQGISPVVYQR